MASYDTFAPYYDLVMGDRKAEAALLRTLLKRHAPAAKTVLELGCGTGSLVAVLQRWYRCTGVDLSHGMVREARRKVPSSSFSQGDITEYRSTARYDAVVCAFDTINHVLSFRDWQAVMRTARHHLLPGGVFIFDMNTQAKLERYAEEGPFAEHMADGTIALVDADRRGSNGYAIRVTALVPQGSRRYLRHDLEVPEVSFPRDRVERAMRSLFERVTFFDAERKRVSARTEELYCIGRVKR